MMSAPMSQDLTDASVTSTVGCRTEESLVRRIEADSANLLKRDRLFIKNTAANWGLCSTLGNRTDAYLSDGEVLDRRWQVDCHDDQRGCDAAYSARISAGSVIRTRTSILFVRSGSGNFPSGRSIVTVAVPSTMPLPCGMRNFEL